MASNYRPQPLQLDHIPLDAPLLELVEILAANAHEMWAHQRMSDGWSFGAERCDNSRRHPCLVPYSELPEAEKTYDRIAVLGTIRAVLALGFAIERRPPEAAAQPGAAADAASRRG